MILIFNNNRYNITFRDKKCDLIRNLKNEKNLIKRLFRNIKTGWYILYI